MSTLRLVILAATLTTGLAAQYHYYLPEMVDGNAPLPAGHAAGTKALNVRTQFVLVNPGKTTANVTIAAIKSDSSPRHINIPGVGSGTNLSTTVAPGAARLFETDGSGDGSEGAAVVTSDSVLSVSEILSNTNAGNPVSESTVPGLGDHDTAAAYMIPVDTVGVDTGIALYNPGSDSASIKVQLIDSKGKTAKSETVTLSGQHHTTIFATAAPLDAKAGFASLLAPLTRKEIVLDELQKCLLWIQPGGYKVSSEVSCPVSGFHPRRFSVYHQDSPRCLL